MTAHPNDQIQVLVTADFLELDGKPDAKRLRKLLKDVPEDAEVNISVYPGNGRETKHHWDLRCTWIRGLQEVQGVAR